MSLSPIGSVDLGTYKVGPEPIYKWSYNPYKWPYKWVTGVITLLIGVINLVINGRGPTLYEHLPTPRLSGKFSPMQVLVVQAARFRQSGPTWNRAAKVMSFEGHAAWQLENPLGCNLNRAILGCPNVWQVVKDAEIIQLFGKYRINRIHDGIVFMIGRYR